MKKRRIDGFVFANGVILIILTLLCLLPIVNVIAISFSGQGPVAAGSVTFWPVDFTLSAYKYVMKDIDFFRSMLVSLKRVVIGPALNLLLTVLCAYPLSKSERVFRARKVYVWVFYFTSLFGGGIIPTYMIVNQMGLINSFWSLVIPGAVPIGYVIMMMNFFRNLPRELEEAALVDGANQWQILYKIYLPLSKASIATISLFCVVNHWNDWFGGVLYFYTTEGQPMATYLHNMITNISLDVMATVDFYTLQELSKISTQTTNAAKLILAMLPVLIMYPFLRKYFAQGIVMGSVKG